MRHRNVFLFRRDAEALAYLSAVLTAFSLLMNFVLQKLGIVLSDKELAKLKEATLLKQVSIDLAFERKLTTSAGQLEVLKLVLEFHFLRCMIKQFIEHTLDPNT